MPSHQRPEVTDPGRSSCPPEVTMNDDRCAHVPTSPGQTVCTCLDRRMWLELLIELQARRITELEHWIQHHEPWVLNA